MGTFLDTKSLYEGFSIAHWLMEMTGLTSTLAVFNSPTGGLSVYIYTHKHTDTHRALVTRQNSLQQELVAFDQTQDKCN